MRQYYLLRNSFASLRRSIVQKERVQKDHSLITKTMSRENVKCKLFVVRTTSKRERKLLREDIVKKE